MGSGFLDIFSGHICSTVAKTMGVTNYVARKNVQKTTFEAAEMNARSMEPTIRGGPFDSRGGGGGGAAIVFYRCYKIFFSKFFGAIFFLSSTEQNFFTQTQRIGYFCVEKCFSPRGSTRCCKILCRRHNMQ